MPIPKTFVRSLDALARMPDPTERARAAGLMLGDLAEAMLSVSQLRGAAARELFDAGMTFTEVAAALGVTRGRAQQIAHPGKFSRHLKQRDTYTTG